MVMLSFHFVNFRMVELLIYYKIFIVRLKIPLKKYRNHNIASFIVHHMYFYNEFYTLEAICWIRSIEVCENKLFTQWRMWLTEVQFNKNLKLSLHKIYFKLIILSLGYLYGDWSGFIL